MKFSTKSKNLQLISNLKLKESIIPKFRYFSVQEWQKKKIRIPFTRLDSIAASQALIESGHGAESEIFWNPSLQQAFSD